jgi:hypothetical protein
MHLQAVLLFIYTPRHALEAPLLLDLLDKRSVYAEVAKWCAILVALGRRGASEIVAMGRAEEEDALTGTG